MNLKHNSKNIGKIFAAVLTVVMILGAFAPSVLADNGKVHVIVENTTFTSAVDGKEPAFTGTAVDTEVDFTEGATMLSCLKAALEAENLSCEVVEDTGYVSSINGLAEKDGGSAAGWMATLNDWFVNESVKDVSVAAGDEVRFMYTCKNMGADLGADYNGNDKTVKDVTFDSGRLEKAFNKDTHEYKLILITGTETVTVTPTASNKNYQVKIFVGETEYKRGTAIPVENGMVITVKCGDPSWPSMSDNTPEAQIYTFTVSVEDEKDIASGTDGNINWVLKFDGTLVISALEGTNGKMKDYASAAKQPWVANQSEVKKVVVEDGVTYIGNFAFNSLPLEYAEIADSVSKIGNHAFGLCRNLKEITIPCSIGNGTFNQCKSLVTVTMKDGFEQAGVIAFTGCSSLENINFPKTLKKFNTTSFPGCNAIKNITVAPGGEFSMQNGLLCQGTKVIYIPPRYEGALDIPEGITEIADNVFKNNKNLTTVKFPSTLTKIGVSAFNGSSVQGEIFLPKSITSYGTNCFSNCVGIKKVTFETNTTDNVTYSIMILTNCINMTSIELPDNFTSLNQMLRGCSGLVSLDLKNITAVSEIDFQQLSSLREITIRKGLTEFKENFDSISPSVIYYEGSEEDWNKITFAENTLKNIEEKDILVVFNYKEGESSGKAPVIKNKLADQDVKQFLRCNAYTVDAEVEEGAKVLYYWYCNNELVGNDKIYSPSTAKIGENKIYVKVASIKDGKIGVAYSNTATLKVSELLTEGLLVGSGTETDPYLIRNADDLDNLSSLVEYFDSFEGKHFKMTADITLPEGWKPIGCTKDGSVDIKEGENLAPFSGIFDGDNHLLTVPKGGLPLLGYIKEAEVKNLRIYGEQIDGYGLVNNFEGVGLKGTAIIIDNVTIESGSRILKSGLLGGNLTTNAFAGNSNDFRATVKNCTIKENVIVGYDGTQSMIGSIAGRMQGVVENCVSYATVRGVDYVGGIIGTRDNAVNACEVIGCEFYGNVEASGDNVGGIAGGGYSNDTAPNGVRITIINCKSGGNITGRNNVGGIQGSDPCIVQNWEKIQGFDYRDYEFSGNNFTGTVKGEKYVGGLIGYFKSLDRVDIFKDNTYTLDCGAENWYGSVEYVDTNCQAPTPINGTTYINTENSTDGCPSGVVFKGYNRTDDPLGADAEKLAKGVPSDKMIAAEVDKLIDAIDMTAEDKAVKVAEARAAYDALTDAQKEYVENLAKLESYEQQLSDEEKADAVEALIDAIGEVTLDSGKAIETAEGAYDALTEDQKALVENLDTLTKARADYNRLKAEYVEGLIEKLPKADEITLKDGDNVKAAGDAYDKLNEDQKKLVSSDNLKKLEEAKAAYEKLVKANGPKTGDSVSIAIYAIMLVAAAATGTVVYKKKKKA